MESITTTIIDFDNAQQVRDYAKNLTKDLDLVGSGANANVYSASNLDYVVKVFVANDNGYCSWLNTVLELGNNNPYLPRIFKIIHLRSTIPTRYPLGYSFADKFIIYMEQLKTMTQSVVSPRQARTVEKCSRKFRWLLGHAVVAGKNNKLDWSTFRPVHQDLIILLLIAYTSHEDNCMDLGLGNVMRRGNRVVVIDPLC